MVDIEDSKEESEDDIFDNSDSFNYSLEGGDSNNFDSDGDGGDEEDSEMQDIVIGEDVEEIFDL